MRNVVAWTAIILDNEKCGQGQQALAFYQQMYLEGVEPNPAYFVGYLAPSLPAAFSQVLALLTCRCQMWDH